MKWQSLPDTEISNKWICGNYLVRYENTIYGYQYIIYENGKQIGSCQTKDGAMKKVDERVNTLTK